MARGTARGKHKRVGERGAPGKIDGDEVFSFIVLERGPDSGEKGRIETAQCCGQEQWQAGRSGSGSFRSSALARTTKTAILL